MRLAADCDGKLPVRVTGDWQKPTAARANHRVPYFDYPLESRPVETPDRPDQGRLGDFFGFFGALKKGEFFGARPKKLRRHLVACLPVRPKQFLQAPFAVGLVYRGRSPDGASATLALRRGRDFFWVDAKKVLPRLRDLIS